jgi:predicted histidine transporter YuiF (NhaC family)
MIYHIAFEALFLTSCIYAILRGAPPERIAAVTFIIAATITFWIVAPAATQYKHFEAGDLALNVIVLLVMIALSITSQRVWPIWMAVMEIFQIAAHLSMLLPLDVDRWDKFPVISAFAVIFNYELLRAISTTNLFRSEPGIRDFTETLARRRPAE